MKINMDEISCMCVCVCFSSIPEDFVACAQRCQLTQSGLQKMSKTSEQKQRAQLKGLEYNDNNNKIVVNYVHCNELITTQNVFKQSFIASARADIFA